MPINQYERKTSDIHISEEFRNLLEVFKDQSTIARDLLYRRLPKEVLSGEHINYITISSTDPTKISYLTQDRIDQLSQDPDYDFWSKSKRFHCKPGAFVSKVFREASPKEVEKFATLYKTFVVKADIKFEVLQGESIREFYDESSYARQTGTLGTSCMKSEECRSFFNLYCDNDVKMLALLTSENKLLGRALIWTINSVNEKGEEQILNFMDRVYTVRDEDYLGLFNKWADDNNYLYKSYNNWCSSLQFTSHGEENEYELDFQLKKWDYGYYPYLDTFKWLDLETGVLSNYRPHYFTEENTNYRCLALADGGTSHGNFLLLDEIERDYAYGCDLIDIDGVLTTSTQCYWSDTLQKWILRTDSIYSTDLEDYIYSDITRVPTVNLKKRLAYVRKVRGKSTLKDQIDEIFNKFIETFKS